MAQKQLCKHTLNPHFIQFSTCRVGWCGRGAPYPLALVSRISSLRNATPVFPNWEQYAAHRTSCSISAGCGKRYPEDNFRAIGRPNSYVIKLISELSRESIVQSNARGSVCLASDCRDILKDVIAIEVKVSDWRKATHQAIRNTIVAHRSYVALPSTVAHRVRNEELIQSFGIGILSVDASGTVRTVRRARKALPKVWSYYFAIATLASESLSGGGTCAI